MNEPIRRKTRADVEAACRQIVIDVGNLPPDTQITDATELGKGYGFSKVAKSPVGLDAIDHVEIICAAEDSHGVTISDAHTNHIETFGQLVDKVAELVGVEREVA